MIDEKRLAAGAEEYRHNADCDFSSQCFFTDIEMIEIIRLARLGLWAEKHRKVIEDCLNGCSGDYCPSSEPDAEQALAALPKEGV
jgi:hypothetical protein